MNKFFCLLLLALLSTVWAGQQKQKKRSGGSKKDGEEEEDDFNDYEIYEAMATMRQLTEHETFYELLGVSTSATDDQVSKAFKKLSVKYHPDKSGGGLETMKMFKLIQYVKALLTTPKKKARYEWLMHEAPAWHRESVYMMKKMRLTAKLSIRQALLFTFLFAIAGQLLIQWIAFFIQYGRIMASRRSLKAMGEKEVKRIRKKLESGDAPFLAQNNSDYETVLLADSERPPFPTPLDLFILAIPLGLVRLVMPKKERVEGRNQ